MRYFDETKPIYLQIMEEMKKKVARGELRAGEKVPSVRDMAKFFGVNPNTVQRAYLELEREGVLETRRGQGTFVTTDKEKIRTVRTELIEEAIDSFRRELKSLGLHEGEIIEILENLKEEYKGDRS